MDLPRTGRPKVLNDSDVEFVLNAVRENPKISAVSITNELSKQKNIRFSPQVVRNTLHKNSFFWKIIKKKTFYIKKKQEDES